jgi:hypothetical protein
MHVVSDLCKTLGSSLSLTVENVPKYLPKSYAMVKGHINHTRQHIRSTQPAVVEPTPESELVQEDKCNFMYATIIETNQIYTYLTGRFPFSQW